MAKYPAHALCIAREVDAYRQRVSLEQVPLTATQEECHTKGQKEGLVTIHCNRVAMAEGSTKVRKGEGERTAVRAVCM